MHGGKGEVAEVWSLEIEVGRWGVCVKGQGFLRMGYGYMTNLAFLGRGLPPWTEGSAHHFCARRRTPW